MFTYYFAKILSNPTKYPRNKGEFIVYEVHADSILDLQKILIQDECVFNELFEPEYLLLENKEKMWYSKTVPGLCTSKEESLFEYKKYLSFMYNVEDMLSDDDLLLVINDSDDSTLVYIGKEIETLEDMFDSDKYEWVDQSSLFVGICLN